MKRVVSGSQPEHADGDTTMSVQCAWCGSKLGQHGSECKTISHGICVHCADELLAELDFVPETAAVMAAPHDEPIVVAV